MAATASQTERFTGFSDDAIQFLLELQAEQSRTWFKAHQAEFTRLCRRPLELLVEELRQRLADVWPGLLEAEPHYFRIQRDTRFSRDKAPYKSNVSADIPLHPQREGDEEHSTPGIYLSFGLEGEIVAVGAWHMGPDTLKRYRQALDDAVRGPALKKSVDGLLAQGWRIEAMDRLKRVPPPYPQDHPCADLLKYKGLALSIQPTEDVSRSHAFVDWAAARLRETAPAVDWLDKVL